MKEKYLIILSVDNISNGNVNKELTEPVNKHLYILLAVNGTIPSHETATNVEWSQNLIALNMFLNNPVIISLTGNVFGIFGS